MTQNGEDAISIIDSLLHQIQPEVYNCDNTCAQRVIIALKYYHSLALDDQHYQDKLLRYCQEINQSLLDDYTHIVTKHQKQLAETYRIMVNKYNMNQCKLADCLSVRRHYRNRAIRNSHQVNQPNNDTESEQYFLFYQDLFDGIHCYFYHLYDIGLRVQLDDIKHDVGNDDFDAVFASTQSIIKAKQSALGKFDFRRYKNNRFELNVVTHKMIDEDTCERHLTETPLFMDGIHQFVQDEHGVCILYEQDYDTDAFEMDVFHTEPHNSNFAQLINDENQFQAIQQYIHHTKLKKRCFQIGYLFYYWNWYKTATVVEICDEMRDVITDPKELYIQLKYKSLKFELLNNQILPLTIYQLNMSLRKATSYINTIKAKQITALHYRISDVIHYHYDIAKGTPLSMSHLLSIILYTDWNDLCYQFSTTFRQITQYETLTDIKNRNREFANWSKLLREAIELFGNCGWDKFESDEWNNDRNMQRGPFFCGLSSVMVFPHFNIRLYSPTSTSTCVEVAERFATDDGIVLQLNNNQPRNSFAACSWNCSWISNYTGEAERLWIGGHLSLRVETIKTMETSINFYRYLKPLFYFDCMLTGCLMNRKTSEDITNDDYVVLLNLIKYELGVNELGKYKYPSYINNTFKVLTNAKTQIVFDLCQIEQHFWRISKLIMNAILYEEPIDNDGFEKQFWDEINNPVFRVIHSEKEKSTEKLLNAKLFQRINLFNPIIFNLFSNLETVVINTTSAIGGYGDITKVRDFEIDILALLSVLDEIQLSKNITITIVIKAMHKYNVTADKKRYFESLSYVGVSWLSKTCDRCSQLIKSHCELKDYGYQLREDTYNIGSYADTKFDILSIRKHSK
eukprot:159626_1